MQRVLVLFSLLLCGTYALPNNPFRMISDPLLDLPMHMVLGFEEYERIREFSLDLVVVDPNGQSVRVPKEVELGIDPEHRVVVYDKRIGLVPPADDAWFHQHWLDTLEKTDPYRPVCGPVWDQNGVEVGISCYPYPATMTQAQRDIYFPLPQQ